MPTPPRASAGRPAAVLPLSLAVCACASVQVGRDLDPATFADRLQRGVTTEAPH